MSRPTILVNGHRPPPLGTAADGEVAIGTTAALTLESTNGITSVVWDFEKVPQGSTAAPTPTTGLNAQATFDLAGEYILTCRSQSGRRDRVVLRVYTAAKALLPLQPEDSTETMYEALDRLTEAVDGWPEASIADGAVTTSKLASNAVTAAKVADEAITDAKLSLSMPRRYVRWWGDSIPEGVSNPIAEQCSFRGIFQDLSRLGGDDVGVLGTRHSWGVSTTANQGPRRWPTGIDRHEGVSGNTIAQVTARVAAAVAAEYARTGRYADVEYLYCGANNAGGTVNAAIADYSVLLDTTLAANPTGRIEVCTIPRTTLVNPAFAPAFNAALATLVATKGPRVHLLDTCSDFTRIEQGTYASAEDVHPYRRGLQRIGRRMYDRFRQLYPLRSGLPSPRPLQARYPHSSLSFSAGNTGLARLGGAFELAIETGTSWLVGINSYFSALPSSWSALCGYGSPYSAGGFEIAVLGGAAKAAGLHVIGGERITANFALQAGQWHRFWAHYDAVQQRLSFWGVPADKPVLFGSLAGPFSFVSPSWKRLFLGYGGTDPVADCLMDDSIWCAGSSVPGFDDLLPHLEAEYFEGASLPGSVSSFAIDSTGVTFDDGHGGSPLTRWSGVSDPTFVSQPHTWDG